MPTRDQDADLERLSEQGGHWNRLRTDEAYRAAHGTMAAFRTEAMLEALCEHFDIEVPPKVVVEDTVVRAACVGDLKEAGETPTGVAKMDPEAPRPRALQVSGDEAIGQGKNLTGEEILGRGYTGGYDTPINPTDDVVRSHNAELTAGMADPDAYESLTEEQESAAEEAAEDPHTPGEPREAEELAAEMVSSIGGNGEESTDTEVDNSDLEDKGRSDLQAEARELGIASGGSNDDLKSRIAEERERLASEESSEDESEDEGEDKDET